VLLVCYRGKSPLTQRTPKKESISRSALVQTGYVEKESMKSKINHLIATLCLVVALGADLTIAATESETELAKKTQNPVADLISVPFQNNFNFGAGSKDKMVYVLNVQPVIPIKLNADWNLITRIITPLINQPSLFPHVDNAVGLGDINPSFFLSPANPGKFIWGVGPTMTFPTATNNILGNGKWSMGPSAVGLFMEGPWVVGALANQQWSFAGWGNKDFNQFLVQPFLNYNFSHGWYLSSAPIITGNFSASSGNHWTVPVGGGGGKLWRVGKVGLPVNTQVQAFFNAERPRYGPDWQLRVQIQFLFPK
jgi:hypothetical protein